MKNLIALFTVIALSACASTASKPVSQDTLNSMSGKSLTIVKRESPSFVAMTAGKGMFAVAGVGAAALEGNKMVKENQIEDPAFTITETIAQTLAGTHGLQLRGQASQVAKSGNVNEVVQLAQDGDYALDVATKGWSYMYNGFKFSDYFVGYTSELRLIDVKTAEVISSGVCIYDAKKAGKSAVTRDKLLENNAAFIKQELADATDSCIAQFTSELL